MTLKQIICSVVLLLLSLNSWSGGYSFRYKDDQGVIHIGYSVPPESIKYGYEILTDSGRVVDKILPKAALDEQAEEMLQQAEMRHQEEMQRARDETLLRYYSEPEDVEIVRSRKLQEMDNFIAIQRANILSYRSRIANLQSQAADLERSGQKASKSLLDTLETLEDNVRDAEQDIADRQKEKQEVSEAFDQDIRRLKELLGKT